METESKVTYIYGLYDPRTDELKYVGKANDPRRRYSVHISQANLKTKTAPSSLWIRELLELGLKPIMKIVEEVPEELKKEKEKYWIAYYKNEGIILLNTTKGGEAGTKLIGEVEETRRRKISESKTGKPSPSRGIKRNQMNGKETTSNYIGVSWYARDKRWTGMITFEGNHYKSKRFRNEKDAAEWYNKMALELFGPDAKLNIIEDNNKEEK